MHRPADRQPRGPQAEGRGDRRAAGAAARPGPAGRLRSALERLDAAAGRRGEPPPAAAHLRALVPDGASVASRSREIIAGVRAGGERRCSTTRASFDTAGAEPRPLLVCREELDGAITQMPLELVAGLQVAIANVAARG